MVHPINDTATLKGDVIKLFQGKVWPNWIFEVKYGLLAFVESAASTVLLPGTQFDPFIDC